MRAPFVRLARSVERLTLPTTAADDNMYEMCVAYDSSLSFSGKYVAIELHSRLEVIVAVRTGMD